MIANRHTAATAATMERDTQRRNAIIDAERSLVSCILLDAARCVEAIAMVNRDDFADPTLGKLFAMVATMFQAGRPVSNARYLMGELAGSEVLEDLGGAARLAELINHAPNAAHAIHHAEQVLRHARRRRLQSLALSLLDQVEDDQADVDDIASSAMRDLTSVMDATNERAICTAADAARAAYDAMMDQLTGRAAAGIETGIQCIDAAAGTMQGGELVVLAARTSVGKTALAVDIMANAAKQGRRSLIISCEMDRRSIGDRLLSRITAINCERISRALVSDHQAAELRGAVTSWNDQPIRIIEASAPTVQQIGAWARAEAARYGLDFLVVDHLGLLSSETRTNNSYERTTRNVQALKALAMSLRMPIVTLCQLNREGEGEIPSLAMLRDSGAIEESADKVWFLHRQRDQTASDFIVAKYRNGSTGAIPQGSLLFDGNRCSYKDAPPPPSEYATDFSQWGGRG
jgi:replicative DNA helicase